MPELPTLNLSDGKNISMTNTCEKFGMPVAGSIPTIIRSYKSAVTRLCHEAGFKHFAWQKNYFEHIILDKRELFSIRQYIKDNPKNWNGVLGFTK